MGLFGRRKRREEAAEDPVDEVDKPTPLVEVYADITCPFTHVGLKRVVPMLSSTGRAANLYIRSWPLEWVNGEPLAYDSVAAKAEALTEQLGGDSFAGLNAASWPETTIPALTLAALAYAHEPITGLAISIELRNALFEAGRDISDHDVLKEIATAHALHSAIGHRARLEGEAIVRDDYEEGQRLGVSGSPHFFVGSANFFCPALDLGHDEAGKLTARFDADGLDAFLSQLETPADSV